MNILNKKLLNNIILEIKNNPCVTQAYLAKKYYYDTRTIRRYFKILKDNGTIIRISCGKNNEWKIINDEIFFL